MALIDIHGLGDVQTALDRHETQLNGGASSAVYDPRLRWLGTALQRTLKAGTQSFGLGICTDSTSNATTDWFAQLANLIAAQAPSYAVNYLQWVDSTQDYAAPAVLQASPGAARSVRFAPSNSNFLASGDVITAPTTDIDIAVKCALDDWTPSASQTLVAHFSASAGNRSFRFQVLANGKLFFETLADGTTAIGHTSSVAPTVVDGATLWVRATLVGDNGASGHDVKFFTSTDGVAWTQLGTTVTTAGTTSLFGSTYQWEIGARNNNIEQLIGNIFEVQVRYGAEGITATTTATGVNAIAATTVNVGSTAAFPSVGTFAVVIGAVTCFVTYTGKTATSFTGCAGLTTATAGSETVTSIRGPVVLPCFPEQWQTPPAGAAGYATGAVTVGSPVLNIVDAGAAGFGVFYLSNASRVKKMLPDYAYKAVFLSSSHNDNDVIGSTTGNSVAAGRGRTLATSWASWITAVKAAAWDAAVVVCTQNPRKSPAGNVADQAIRREMLLALATQLGHPSLDAYQAFLDSSGNLIASYLQSDGIHPTATGAGDGMHLWASYAYTALFG